MLNLARIDFAAWTAIDWIKLIIVVAAAIGIMYVALTYFQVKIPDWFLKIIGIVVVCIVALIAINLIMAVW